VDWYVYLVVYFVFNYVIVRENRFLDFHRFFIYPGASVVDVFSQHPMIVIFHVRFFIDKQE